MPGTGDPVDSEVPTTDDLTAPAGVDGTWVAVQDSSTVGYRIQEVLAGVDTEAAGRTDQVTGSITIDGTQVTAADFTVDMATFTSDESRRDGQFNGRIMSVDQFPTVDVRADRADRVRCRARPTARRLRRRRRAT